jgi:3-hydroxyacyl-[acyl-carrier-protein] dehydratase
MELNIRQIQEIIPHRYPFLLIDKVLDVQPNEKLVAVKNVTVNEPFFVGHFPNEKVMPGVLILEAMAQAGCIYFYYSKGLQGKSLIYYLGKVEAKFMQPVVPGDQLKIEISSVKLMSKAGILKGRAFVKDKVVAEAEVAFGVKEI